jgi:hypothetical protein
MRIALPFTTNWPSSTAHRHQIGHGWEFVLEHVSDIINIDQIVDRHHVNIGQGAGAAKDQSANATKSINADFDGHRCNDGLAPDGGCSFSPQ